MANVRFDQFIDGGEMQIGDIPVGLRVTDLANNYKFNFPGSGIKDSSGNYLFRYSTVGAIATNYLQFINSVSGNAVVLTAGGTDPNIGITISPLADGVLTLDTLAWPTSDGLPNSFLFTDGAGHLHFTNGSVVTTITGTQHQVLVNGTFGIPQGGPVTLSTPQDIDINSSPTFILTNCTGLPLTTGVVGVLPLANGGTNAALSPSNGGIVYSTSSALAILPGTATASQVLLSGSNSAPSWSNATYPTNTIINQLLYSIINDTVIGLPTVNSSVLITTTSGIPGFTSSLTDGQIVIGATGGIPAASTLTAGSGISIVNSSNSITISSNVSASGLTKVDDTNVTMALGGSPSNALLQPVSMTLGWTGQLSLTRGGTNANLTASNGGIVYSTASALAILPGTATANQIILSGSNTAPSWSTATYPATTTINQLLYSSAANTITGLPTVNSAVLITDTSGTPGFTSSLIDGQIVIGATGGIPTAANLTAGTNITITNAANSITIAAAGSGITPSALTAVNDTNVTLSLTGTPATALLQAVTATMGWTGQLSLTRGGTNASLTASNGGIVYSTASALAILPGTATASQVLLSGSNSAPSWSNATYPTNTIINQLLYSIANNTITGLSTVNKAVLTTDSSGTPGFVALSSNGQLIIGSTSSIPAASTLTAGSGISIVNGSNSITISSNVSASALTAVNDTNVTLSLTGTPATALLQAVTATMGWSGQLSLARGGTNANLTAVNGGIVYSTASALAILSPTSSAVLVTSLTGIPQFTSHMFDGQVVIGALTGTPTAANLTAGAGISITNAPNSITIAATASALTAVNDTNVTLSLTGTPATALLQAVTATMGWSGQLSLARGGTGASLSSTNSATLVTNSSGTSTFTSTMTNGQVVIGSTGATPTAATLTGGTGISITNGAGSITIAATGATSGRLLNIQVFINNGTYTPTPGLSNALIQCLAGGGAGGGASSTPGNCGGGGGSGGFSQSFVPASTIGASQTVTVGAGGTGVSNGTGNNGANTSVGTIVIALGGSGGQIGGLSFAVGGAGGAIGTGDVVLPGNAGVSVPTGVPTKGGEGAGSIFGGGTLAVVGTGGDGNFAISGTGAGGSGALAAASPKAGGGGGSGIVYIYEYS